MILQDPMCGFGTKAVSANSVVVFLECAVQMQRLYVSDADNHRSA